MMKLIGRLFGESNQKAIESLQPVVDEINALEPEFESLSDAALKAKTDEFRRRMDAGESVDDILPEAFAAVRESAKRNLGQRAFDVQLMGGIVLHQGKIAEMRTGEGKTLVATFAVYLNALAGKGVHVVTVNDYLAKRDPTWMGPIYHGLGISLACLQNNASWRYDPEWAEAEAQAQREKDPDSAPGPADPMRPVSKQEAYATDVTYGTNNEFGFDYLRDNMVRDLSGMVQRDLHYAIVDEVDNILIDEARTPLIISGPARESGQEYRRFAQLARQLKTDVDFTVDEKQRAISLTEDGIGRVERALKISNLYDPQHYALTHFVENAVRAENLYQRDRDYVVRENEVIIVDEFTGRMMQGRRWSDGMHQAVEAKEGVRVQRETITYATITLQNYFRIYEKLAGMTGTAATEAEEFYKIYKLDVVQVPTNMPMVRDDAADLIYKSEAGKYKAVADRVAELHAQGRPALVGTVSIEKSEVLSDLLTRSNIPHQVLNAKQHEREAGVVAQAGRPGAVTVATNMAGRGTDIILGGNPETVDITQEEWQRDHDRIVEAGGLCIIGTERHESRRIDNQLRGRAGRQGDPGSSIFYVSTEDDLIRRFGGERIKGVMNFVGLDEDTPIENRMVSHAVESAQSRVEGTHFEIRKHLVDYDDVVNTHRDVIYQLRGKVIQGEDLRAEITGMMREALAGIVTERLMGDPTNWDIEGFQRDVTQIMPLPPEFADADEMSGIDKGEVGELLEQSAEVLYEDREQQFSPEVMRNLERAVMLQTIDGQWVEHLTAMENMRQGIGLEAAGQRDPLVQYKRQGYEMFSGLMDRINQDVVNTIFRVALNEQPAQQGGRRQAPAEARRPAAAGVAARASAMAGGGTAVSAVAERHGARSAAAGRKKIGRNDPCPCGSGKKYKRCCGR